MCAYLYVVSNKLNIWNINCPGNYKETVNVYYKKHDAPNTHLKTSYCEYNLSYILCQP